MTRTGPTRLDQRRRVEADLRQVYAAPGPFVSVYLDVRPGAPRKGAARRLAERLTTAGPVSDPAAHALAGVVEGLTGIESPSTTEGHPAAGVLLDEATGMLTVLVAADGTSVTAHLPDPPATDVVRVGQLPTAGPLFEALQAQVHHLVAVIDDRGADVVQFPPRGLPVVDRSEVRSPDALAAWLAGLAAAVDTDLVVLAGPEHPVADTHEALLARLGPEPPVAVADLDLDTARAGVGASSTASAVPDQLADTVVRLVATQVATETVEALRLWRFHLAHGAASNGLVDTVDELRAGRLGLLLVHDDPDDERSAWFGTAPTDLAIDLETLDHTLRWHQPTHARLVDVLVRSAFLQGAGIRMIPSTGSTGPLDDIGGVLADRQRPALWGRAVS